MPYALTISGCDSTPPRNSRRHDRNGSAVPGGFGPQAMTTTPPAEEKTLDVDEGVQDTPRPQPPMTMHVYPLTQASVKLKRRQVKNACTNCKKACKKCDDARPCLRCVKYGISECCVDSQRKPRLRVKRGPYKRKVKGGNANKEDTQQPIQTASAASPIQPDPPHAELSNICGCCPPIDYPENFFNHFSPIVPQVESVGVCTPIAASQPYFLASVPEFQSYSHPIQHGPEFYVHPPPAYYTYVFPSVSYHPGQ